MSHYGYVIAASEEEADELVRRYILSSYGEQRIMEGWNISMKGGEHDAYALFRKHQDAGETDAKLWRVALALLPVDVPRETSGGDDASA